MGKTYRHESDKFKRKQRDRFKDVKKSKSKMEKFNKNHPQDAIDSDIEDHV